MAKTDATDGDEWSQIPSVRRQLEAFAAVCGQDMLRKGDDGRTFIKALAEYTQLYENLWRPNLGVGERDEGKGCLLYTSPSPRDATLSRMPSSA